jgi:hypothetical protein
MATTTVEYLENERQKIWASIVELQDSINKKTSDYENEAKQASKKCSEFKNKCESARNDSEALLKKIQITSDEITKSSITALISDIQTFHTNLAPKKEEIETQIDELEELFNNYETYAEKLEKLDTISTNADDSSTKIEAILTQISSRKKDIDQLYYEMFGSTKTDPATGAEIKVTGKKDELDKTYHELKVGFDKFSKDKKTEFDATLDGWKKSYSAALTEIQSLLPNALTTGLSAAYSIKKEDEIKEIFELKESFKNWIFVLMAISLIPFAVSLYLLIFDKIPLQQVVLQLSSLVSPILMLYVPPLWIALSTNKKINISKRLIEEYTHKEVVAKTFEGLSKQIEGIKDHKVSADLKIKLLSNILEISTENPGKLLSDYNKSDHPILEKFSGMLNRNGSKPSQSKSDISTTAET